MEGNVALLRSCRAGEGVPDLAAAFADAPPAVAVSADARPLPWGITAVPSAVAQSFM
jgi:hypothetical protein